MLPKIAIWSLFRDDAGANLANYRRRVTFLDYPPELLRFYLVEGDSTDGTLAELQEWAEVDDRLTVLKCDTGLRYHGSTTDPERFEILKRVGNTAIEAIANDNWSDLAMLIESDLDFMPDTINRLLEHRQPGEVIAPMIWIPTGENYRFYDIWAFRFLDGRVFPPNVGAWYAANCPDPLEVESVGSMVIFPIEAIRAGVRYDSEVIRGMVMQAGKMGHKVICDPTTHVLHPENHR